MSEISVCNFPAVAGKRRAEGTARQARARGSLALDDQLCFALYAASRAVTQLYRPLLDGLGLTYPQYLVMLVLWQRGTTTVKGLAEALQLDHGTSHRCSSGWRPRPGRASMAVNDER